MFLTQLNYNQNTILWETYSHSIQVSYAPASNESLIFLSIGGKTNTILNAYVF